MKCRAWVAERPYSPPGPCQNTRGLKFIRWAPTPLKTFAGCLCLVHRTIMERGGTVLFAAPKELATR